ncbi:cold shock domain-containing protein, partial [Escherichia coli]|uniref:cold-shock protein n=1 Tax=Escherichia coli TaxID=562 RepID=UPI0027381B80
MTDRPEHERASAPDQDFEWQGRGDASGSEVFRVTGTVKWFDATRGFGFLVSDEVDGDILVHFSSLRAHGR